MATNIEKIFDDSINCLQRSQTELIIPIKKANDLLIDTLKRGNKVLLCGNGGSSADAIHFSAELLNRFVVERRPLPAIALTSDTATITAIGNDYDFAQIFSKQISALGNEGDLLIAFSTSGNSQNIVTAVNSAIDKSMAIITLTGNHGGLLSSIVKAPNINICVPSSTTARIQEVHGLIIHCLCTGVDENFS